MLRGEVQRETGLTRRAIEYYEECNIINPKKLDNGYRDYSEEDLKVLKDIYLYRKLGLNLSEIKDLLLFGKSNLSDILRKREYLIGLEEKQREILKLIANNDSENLIIEKLKSLEKEETVFRKLQLAFPGYFGQIFFSAYAQFLDVPLNKECEKAYNEYINYLDNLPTLNLTEEEKEYINNITSDFTLKDLKNVNEEKVKAVNNIEKWFEDNRYNILSYDEFKNSETFLNSPLKKIEDKLKDYMLENKYYEIAIPLIRKFSPSYNEYYISLISANEKYISIKNKSILKEKSP